MSCCNNFLWLILCLYLSSSSIHGSNDSTGYFLDSFIQESAFKALVRHRPHTGALYKAMLPSNLSGMEVAVIRLRSKTLWRKGVNVSNFHIPPRTVSIPHVKRLTIVYHNLGNWSSSYYNVPGYSLVTSVVGFLVFDASNVGAKSARNISLGLMEEEAITVSFPGLVLPRGMISAAKCVAFGSNGTIDISGMISPNVCYGSDQGHFSVVVGLERKQKPWYLWVTGTVLGCGVLVLVAYSVVVVGRRLKTKEIESMEKHAEDAEILDNRWIGSSKLPSATITRTQPDLEN